MTSSLVDPAPSGEHASVARVVRRSTTRDADARRLCVDPLVMTSEGLVCLDCLAYFLLVIFYTNILYVANYVSNVIKIVRVCPLLL